MQDYDVHYNKVHVLNKLQSKTHCGTADGCESSVKESIIYNK